MHNASTWKVRFLATAIAVLLVLSAGAAAASTADSQAKSEGKAPSETKKAQPPQKNDEGQQTREPTTQSEQARTQSSPEVAGRPNCSAESLVNTLEDVYGFDQNSQQTSSARVAKVTDKKEKPNAESRKKSGEEQQAVKWRELEPKKDD